MKKQNKLVLERSIFLLFVIVSFGLIIVNEKKDLILLPKIDKQLTDYYNNKYKKQNLFELKNIKKENDYYLKKVVSLNNKNHFFYIKYHNKKITDTYKLDYIEGNSLLSNIKKNLEKKLNSKEEIIINKTLDKYTDTVKEKIIKEDFSNIKFYNIKKELIISSWDSNTIYNEITTFIETIKNKNLNPKYYEFVIIDKNELTKSIDITNIDEDFNDKTIIDLILDKKELTNNITIKYKYLNEEE